MRILFLVCLLVPSFVYAKDKTAEDTAIKTPLKIKQFKILQKDLKPSPVVESPKVGMYIYSHTQPEESHKHNVAFIIEPNENSCRSGNGTEVAAYSTVLHSGEKPLKLEFHGGLAIVQESSKNPAVRYQIRIKNFSNLRPTTIDLSSAIVTSGSDDSLVLATEQIQLLEIMRKTKEFDAQGVATVTKKKMSVEDLQKLLADNDYFLGLKASCEKSEVVAVKKLRQKEAVEAKTTTAKGSS